MGILEKMKNWVTWEDIVKDSDPYLQYLSDKILNGDFSFLAEFDDLKEVIARLEAEFFKVFEKARPACEAGVAAEKELFELYKMIDDKEKLENLLASDTLLNKYDKRLIIIQWEGERAWGTNKVVKSFGSETIEECIKRKRDEVSEAISKAVLLQPRIDMINESVQRALDVKRWINMYTDVHGWSPPASPSPPPSPSPSPPPSPTNKRVMDNIGSSSPPTNKRVKHNTGSTSSLDESFVLA